MLKHVLKSQQFSRAMLEELFRVTDDFKKLFCDKSKSTLRGLLANRLLFNIFYEPSTRTRISFGAAAAHLGMHVVETENAKEFSSAIKGETLEDTIRVLCEYYPDAIVLRHYEAGAAEKAAEVATSGVSIINAGDGGGQHPTQALLDLFTIKKEIGRLDELSVCMGGDLANGRTVRSLAYLLTKFKGTRFIFVSPPELGMKEDILEHLTEHKIEFRAEEELKTALPKADVVYWTRIQRERIEDRELSERVANFYQIGPDQMAFMQKKSILMHPLPRVKEIKPEVDSDPRAAYFRQAGNGMFIRMALLHLMLKSDR